MKIATAQRTLFVPFFLPDDTISLNSIIFPILLTLETFYDIIVS